jgi:hypothetical protein
MKPRGVVKLFQDEQGKYLALCNDGTMWVSLIIDGTGNSTWRQVDPIPKRDQR